MNVYKSLKAAMLVALFLTGCDETEDGYLVGTEGSHDLEFRQGAAAEHEDAAPQAPIACLEQDTFQNCEWKRTVFNWGGGSLHVKATCPSDYVVVGGSCYTDEDDARLKDAKPFADSNSNTSPGQGTCMHDVDQRTGWSCRWPTAPSGRYEAHSMCCWAP